MFDEGARMEEITVKASLVEKEVSWLNAEMQTAKQQEDSRVVHCEVDYMPVDMEAIIRLLHGAPWQESTSEAVAGNKKMEAVNATPKTNLPEKERSLQEAQEQLLSVQEELNTLQLEVAELKGLEKKITSCIQTEQGEIRKIKLDVAKKPEMCETTALKSALSDREAALQEACNQLVELREQLGHAEEARSMAENRRTQLITEKENLQAEIDYLKEKNSRFTSVGQKKTAKILELENAKGKAGDLQIVEELTSALKNKENVTGALGQTCRSLQTLVELQKGTNQMLIDSPSYLASNGSIHSTPRNKPSIPEPMPSTPGTPPSP